jgi:predicted CoA-binding protein
MKKNITTLVIGASENTSRYAAMAIAMLKDYGHKVHAVGRKEGEIYNTTIHTSEKTFEDVHTVTLYINPEIQKTYYDYILALKPNRVIFNPGAENLEFSRLLKEADIQMLNACTLVLLRTGQYGEEVVTRLH